MKKPVCNEIHVIPVVKNGYTAFRIMRGDECISELASNPSDSDVRNALLLHSQRMQAQPESARVRQLSEKRFRHGQFPRDDDSPKDAA